jgi:GNAT superfamily N-acetyltransferase
MLKLVPMSESEFAEYESETLTNYASDLLKADGGSPDTAMARATQAFLKILPEGRNTPNHHFFILLESDVSTAVGWLWLGEATSERGRGAFIYDLLVRPKHRGQGYGTNALQAVESWASELGMKHIDLHVFGHNSDARRLYKRTGYQPTHIHMTKPIS